MYVCLVPIDGIARRRKKRARRRKKGLLRPWSIRINAVGCDVRRCRGDYNAVCLFVQNERRGSESSNPRNKNRPHDFSLSNSLSL